MTGTVASRDSRLARIIPTIAANVPTNCRAPGLSPWAMPAITGTTAPELPMGPTMLILPMARALK